MGREPPELSVALPNEDQLRADIVEIGRRLWLRGFVASNDGNISVRLSPDRLLMTPASVSKGFMTPEMLVVTDLEGTLIAGAPGRKPSSETLMHLVAYRERPDVNAVVHAHPPLSTGFAVAGIPLDRAVLAEVVTTLGSIPIADYATPSTSHLADAVEPYVKTHDGLLLANHGALALGKDLFAAYYKMETIEHFARISLVARQLGRENLLSREEVVRLQNLRGRYGIAAPAPICPDPAPADEASDPSCQVLIAPSAPGEQIVPNTPPLPVAMTTVGTGGEIRLTYAQLTALIDEAVREVTDRLEARGSRLEA
jgi:L-fuculose-phosphate aldolase